ncbi:hypothetical protein [Oleiharenicola lentus]|uniref:hypothetical protein n=1 Tax=Oleiharenicola lentus TaxID=2508720 RepID=UPI003F672FFC
MPSAEARLVGYLTEILRDYEACRAKEDIKCADASEARFRALLNDDTAAAMIQVMPPDFAGTFFGDLALRWWASKDRAAAAEWMASHPTDSPVAAVALTHDWALQDPKTLNAYVDTLPPGPWKHNLLKSAGEETLVADRLAETLAFLDKISGNDSRRDELYEWTATKWAIKDPTAATEWAAKAADGAQREKLLAAVVVGYANSEPDAAAQLAINMIASKEQLLPAVNSVGRIWASRDALSAGNWVQQMDAGEPRASAMRGLLQIWAFSDFERARAWQEGIGDAQLRVEAAAVLAQLKRQIDSGTGPAPLVGP